MQFVNTKSKRRRSVPIPPELEQRLHSHLRRYGKFSNCRDSFDFAVKMSGVALPVGRNRTCSATRSPRTS